MKRRLKQKIEQLREQPEHIRMRKLSMFTWGAGIFLVVGWLGVLLPLQLRVSRDTEDPTPAVQGIATQSPTPTPTLTPTTRPTLRPTLRPSSTPPLNPSSTSSPIPSTEAESELNS